ncbi:MAG: hypothetical protein JO289_17665 [Xanthobacteraceae bacterium]|nr:hypothetical protein [Xanthobacteraceae bacterium]
MFLLDSGKRRTLCVPFQQIQRAMRGSEDVAQVRAFCRRSFLFAFALGVEQLLPAVGKGPAQTAGRAHHEQLSHAPIASAGRSSKLLCAAHLTADNTFGPYAIVPEVVDEI